MLTLSHIIFSSQPEFCQWIVKSKPFLSFHFIQRKLLFTENKKFIKNKRFRHPPPLKTNKQTNWRLYLTDRQEYYKNTFIQIALKLWSFNFKIKYHIFLLISAYLPRNALRLKEDYKKNKFHIHALKKEDYKWSLRILQIFIHHIFVAAC